MSANKLSVPQVVSCRHDIGSHVCRCWSPALAFQTIGIPKQEPRVPFTACPISKFEPSSSTEFQFEQDRKVELHQSSIGKVYGSTGKEQTEPDPVPVDLSVIIPIYNTPVEDLQRCFSFAAKLCTISLEVLLIDDGSKQEVASFCQTYARNHPAFRYFRQNNSGVRMARNRGLDNARGKFVCFLDSDDEIYPEVLKQALQIPDADLILFNLMAREGYREQLRPVLENRDSGPVSLQEILLRLVSSDAVNTSCGKLLRRSLLEENGIRFSSGMIQGEDLDFVQQCLETEPRMYFLNQTGYCYYQLHANTSDRMIRQPEQTLQDLHRVFSNSKSMIRRFIPEQADPLEGQLNAREVRELFRWVCDQVQHKQLTRMRKEQVRSTVLDCCSRFPCSSGSSRLLYRLIVCRLWIVFPLMARLRLAYRKHKPHS